MQAAEVTVEAALERGRLMLPDVWNDDPEVPTLIEIHWSRSALIVTGVIMAAIALIGSNTTVSEPADLGDWCMVVISVLIGGADIRKLSDRRSPFRLDELGITLLERPCIAWDPNSEERITVESSGLSSHAALEFRHTRGAVEIPVDHMDISKKVLLHRMQVDRFRSGHFPKSSS